MTGSIIMVVKQLSLLVIIMLASTDMHSIFLISKSMLIT